MLPPMKNKGSIFFLLLVESKEIGIWLWSRSFKIVFEALSIYRWAYCSNKHMSWKQVMKIFRQGISLPLIYFGDIYEIVTNRKLFLCFLSTLPFCWGISAHDIACAMHSFAKNSLHFISSNSRALSDLICFTLLWK